MNAIRIVMQLVMVALGIFGISVLMEFYKKKIRKDQAKVWEIRVIAAVLSCLAAVGYKVTGLFTPVLTAIWPNLTVWVDVALYAVVIFLGQLQGDMKFVKAIIKFATENVLNDKEALVAELKKFIVDFNVKTKVNVTLVVNVLKALGVTEETVAGYLKDIGVDDDKAALIIEAFNESLKEK